MSFWIEGWVEIARSATEPGSWQAVIRLGPLIDAGDVVSERLFGLSKRVVSGECEAKCVAANRGVPGDPSRAVKRDIAAIAEHERKFGRGEFGGYTWARWSELRSVLPETVVSGSQWSLVFDLVCRIIQDLQLDDDQVRLVVWFSW